MAEKTCNKPKRFSKKRLITIGGVLMVIFVLLVPIPAILLDILWQISLISVLLIICIMDYYEKANGYSFLPSFFIINTFIGLLIQISFTRIILTTGEEFDDIIIRTLSLFILNQHEITKQIIAAIIFFIFAVITLIVAKGFIRISELSAIYSRDTLQLKLRNIELEYSYGKITEEKVNSVKNAFQRENEYYGSIPRAAKFISCCSKASLIIAAASIIGGIFIGTSLNGEPIYNALKTYIPLSLSNAFLVHFLYFVQITAGSIATRGAREYEGSNIPKAY